MEGGPSFRSGGAAPAWRREPGVPGSSAQCCVPRRTQNPTQSSIPSALGFPVPPEPSGEPLVCIQSTDPARFLFPSAAASVFPLPGMLFPLSERQSGVMVTAVGAKLVLSRFKSQFSTYQVCNSCQFDLRVLSATVSVQPHRTVLIKETIVCKAKPGAEQRKATVNVVHHYFLCASKSRASLKAPGQGHLPPSASSRVPTCNPPFCLSLPQHIGNCHMTLLIFISIYVRYCVSVKMSKSIENFYENVFEPNGRCTWK